MARSGNCVTVPSVQCREDFWHAALHYLHLFLYYFLNTCIHKTGISFTTWTVPHKPLESPRRKVPISGLLPRYAMWQTAGRRGKKNKKVKFEQLACYIFQSLTDTIFSDSRRPPFMTRFRVGGQVPRQTQLGTSVLKEKKEEMPRKKPFSSKQKKKQLQQKRGRVRDKPQGSKMIDFFL